MALPIIKGIFGCEDLVIVTDYSSVKVAEFCNHYVLGLDPEDLELAHGIRGAGVQLAVESPEERKVDGVGSVGGHHHQKRPLLETVYEGEDQDPPLHLEVGRLLLDVNQLVEAALVHDVRHVEVLEDKGDGHEDDYEDEPVQVGCSWLSPWWS